MPLNKETKPNQSTMTRKSELERLFSSFFKKLVLFSQLDGFAGCLRENILALRIWFCFYWNILSFMDMCLTLNIVDVEVN